MTENCKELKEKARITLRTINIGTLEILEKELGHLWGHDKPEHESLDEDEQYYLSIWEDVRNQIFERKEKSQKILLGHINKLMKD